MKDNEKIEKLLRSTADVSVPDGLQEKLQGDLERVALKKRHSIIHSWLAPSGESVSPRRIACAAAIAIACLIPISYGAVKIIKTFTVEVEGVNITTAEKGDNINSEKEAKESIKEMLKIIRDGKAKEIRNDKGIYVYKGVRSDGEEFTFGSHSPIEPNGNLGEKRKEVRAEAEKLREAGKFERTFLKEIVGENGMIIHLYEEVFTLSNGEVFSTTYAESVPATEEK